MNVDERFQFRKVDWCDANHDKRLVYAAIENRLDVAREALAAGAAVDVYRGRALREAASRGHATMVGLLLAACASLYEDFASGIDNAIKKGHVEVIKAYLDAGMPVDYSNNWLLYCAINANQVEVVVMLLEHGADFFGIHASHRQPITDPFAQLEMTPEVRAVIGRWLLRGSVKNQRKKEKKHQGLGL